MKLDLHVLSAGAVTSLGLSLPATSAAIRAGLDNFQDTQFHDEGGPVIGARVNTAAHEDGTHGGSREHARWAGMAIEECFVGLPSDLRDGLKVLRLFFIMPNTEQPSLVDNTVVKHSCIDTLRRLSGLKGDAVSLAEFRGSVGFGDAILASQHWCETNAHSAAIIFSSDSWLNNPRIQYGMHRNRVLSHDRAEGFVPGEGAAAICVSHAPNQATRSASLHLTGIGFGEENAALYSESPCFGKGLADATRESLASAEVPIHEIHLRLANVSGEEYFFDECAYAWARLLRQPMTQGYESKFIATNVGHLGPAMGPLMVGHAFHLHRQKRHAGVNTLIQLSSESQRRMAVALRLQ